MASRSKGDDRVKKEEPEEVVEEKQTKPRCGGCPTCHMTGCNRNRCQNRFEKNQNESRHCSILCGDLAAVLCELFLPLLSNLNVR